MRPLQQSLTSRMTYERELLPRCSMSAAMGRKGKPIRVNNHNGANCDRMS